MPLQDTDPTPSFGGFGVREHKKRQKALNDAQHNLYETTSSLNELVRALGRPTDVGVANEYFTIPRVIKGVPRDILGTLAQQLMEYQRADAEARGAEEQLRSEGLGTFLGQQADE